MSFIVLIIATFRRLRWFAKSDCYLRYVYFSIRIEKLGSIFKGQESKVINSWRCDR